jgi:hypothetical protein
MGSVSAETNAILKIYLFPVENKHLIEHFQ